jgi:hypothetical protein
MIHGLESEPLWVTPFSGLDSLGSDFAALPAFEEASLGLPLEVRPVQVEVLLLVQVEVLLLVQVEVLLLVQVEVLLLVQVEVLLLVQVEVLLLVQFEVLLLVQFEVLLLVQFEEGIQAMLAVEPGEELPDSEQALWEQDKLDSSEKVDLD